MTGPAEQIYNRTNLFESDGNSVGGGKPMNDRQAELLNRLRAVVSGDFNELVAYERLLLDDYGLDGAHVIVTHRGHHVADARDAAFPWNSILAATDDPGEIARAVFRPLQSRLPTFTQLLYERLLFVVPTLYKSRPNLCYVTNRKLYDGTPYFEVLSGGPPDPSPELSPRLRQLGWQLPKSLREFYRVHDGLAPEDSVNGIWECRRLVDLGELMDPIAEQVGRPPEGYRFTDLLCFREDGAGNGENFYRDGTNDSDPTCVDWDHETWEISGEATFFEFADRHLAGQIEDEE